MPNFWTVAFRSTFAILFGEYILDEVLAAVLNADTDPIFSAQNDTGRALLETLNAVPQDACLAGLVGTPPSRTVG